MRRLKVVLLALGAVMAVSAVASATASAAKPEFVFTGTEKGFTGKQVGSGTLETKGGTKVSCTAGTSTGEIEGASGSNKVTKTVVTFTACTSSGFECHSPGASSGEIKTKELKGQLGYISSTEKTVGLDLEPKEGEFFVEFTCFGFLSSKVKGQVIGKLTPVNKEVKTTEHFTLAYEQTGGVQKITELEIEGVKDTGDILSSSLNGGAEEQAGEQSTQELTPKATVTISA
jgi:hypothetical protein